MNVHGMHPLNESSYGLRSFSSKELEIIEKFEEKLKDIIDIPAIEDPTLRKASFLLQKSSNKIFYEFEKGKTICKDLKTLILDHPKNSIHETFSNLHEKIKNNEVFFGYRIPNKKTTKFQYIIHEEHKEKFANQEVIHKEFNKEKKTIETTISKAEDHTVHTMNVDQYRKMMDVVLSRIETVSATFLTQQEQAKNARQDLSLTDRGSVLKQGQLLAKQSIANLMKQNSDARRRDMESRTEQKMEQEKYLESENIRKKRREEKEAKYEKRMKNVELQEESKAIKKGKTPPTGRSFQTKQS